MEGFLEQSTLTWFLVCAFVCTCICMRACVCLWEVLGVYSQRLRWSLEELCFYCQGHRQSDTSVATQEQYSWMSLFFRRHSFTSKYKTAESHGPVLVWNFHLKGLPCEILKEGSSIGVFFISTNTAVYHLPSWCLESCTIVLPELCY